MSDKPKKGGFLKRLFKFGKKEETPAELAVSDLQEVEDATSNTALAESDNAPVVAHAEAAANVIVDTEAGADLDATPGIEPLVDKAEDAPTADEIDQEAAAERALAEAEARRAGEAVEEPQEVDAASEDQDEPEEEAEESPAAEDGVFGAPPETRADEPVETPEPLAQTPEPMPEVADTSGDEEDEREEDAAFAGAVEEEPFIPVANPRKRGEEPEPVKEKPAPKRRWFERLRTGLARSSGQLTDNISAVFTKKKLDEDTLQDLEDILIQADLGVETAMNITDALAAQRIGKDVTGTEVREFMAGEVEKTLAPVAAELELDLDHTPHVILVVGVNGSGKTTTIGKLSQKLYDAGFSTLLVAGDTFRAAAIEQLHIWGDRTQSPVVSRPLGSDAAGLAFDAYTQAKEEGRDVMLMDTAGRLQNKAELMDELEKIVRVLKKHDPEAPHTVLLTLDATTGQNALSQVEIFKDVAGVNGLVMTKLDGTARGGIMVAIAAKYKLPVYFIGVGEHVDDLEPFEAGDFARSIAGLT
ncbi:MAG: signal recognition particle-docking protein FtsY [Pseudomonadota bacterium]